MINDYLQGSITGITIMDFAKYLTLKGFRRNIDFPNKNLLVFNKIYGEGAGQINIVIPASETFDDYYIRLEESIITLSQLERKNVFDIIDEIVKPNIDKLQIRVISDIATEGSVPLSYAANFVGNLKELIVAAACAEENPEPYYSRALKRAVEHADTVRFGQTQKGSFIATIESYVPIMNINYMQKELHEESNLEEQQTPFSRRVMQRIQLGIAQLEQAILNGSIDNVIKDGYKIGLNANMCEALMKLKTGTGDMKFEYKMNWSPVLPAPKHIPEKVVIERNGFELLDTLARTYRGAVESTKKKIAGYIIGLSANELDDDDNEDSKRIAIVRLDGEDENIKKVKVQLGVEDYRLACDAHRDGKRVEVQGILERDGKQWRLTKPELFKAVE